MTRPRIIPVLLLQEGLLVKTQQFRKPTYIGDPVNTVKIFNQKEVDELAILDMDAGRGKGRPRFELIAEIASEAFMPISYGGGVRSLADATRLVSSGIEKVIVNTAAAQDPSVLTELAERLGSQAVVASIDYSSRGLSRQATVRVAGGTRTLRTSPVELALDVVAAGAGEILLGSIDHEGMMQGLDVATIATIASAVPVPVIATGGAGTIDHLRSALDAGASGVAASSMFVYHGPHKAVLITYRSPDEFSC